jgi:peptidoglycan/xylan/chitin deacetylase (PgdA/CDA1 family)
VKKPLKFGLHIGLFIIGITFGIVVARFSGGILTGQPSPIPTPKISDGPEYSRRQPVSNDLVMLFPKLITRQGNSQIRNLALTFDDGPDLKYTPKILDTLKKYNVKATFFVVGTQVQKYPTTFHRIIHEGHEIGSHSFQHLKFPQLSADQIKYQLTHNNEIIHQNGGKPIMIFRPPYGALDPTSVEMIGKLGYKIILWTIDSLDWRGLKEQQVISNVVPKINRGDIVLQHCAANSKLEDLRGSNEALPEIIKTAKIHGYRFVTISQMLEERKEAIGSIQTSSNP